MDDDKSKQELCYFCLRNPQEKTLQYEDKSFLSCFICYSMLEMGKTIHGQKKGVFPEKGIFSAQVDEILPQKLYLGNFEGSRNLEMLKKNKITHILVAGNYLKEHFPEQFVYKTLNLFDDFDQDIKQTFDLSYDFIEKGNIVFVHCQAGSSRSATLVIAYLMKKQQWSLNQAYSFVKKQRSKIHPNKNFKQQLLEYENQLNNIGKQIQQNNPKL